VCTPAGGSHSPPAAGECCLGGEVGASSLSWRAFVPPWGSNPRPQDLAAALPRACGSTAPEGVCGAVGACAQCSPTPRPSTATCRRGMSAASSTCGTVRTAPLPPSPALVCAPEPGEVTLHPTHRNSISARSRRALHREGGGAQGVQPQPACACPTVGLEPPTTRLFRSAATGVWLPSPSGRAWGVGCLRAVFQRATAFNGDLSAWNVGSVARMNGSACGPASIPPPAALVCASHWGKSLFATAPEQCLRGTRGVQPPLHPSRGGTHSPPAAPEHCVREGGRGNLLLAFVRCALWSWVRAPRWNRQAKAPRGG
jgi:hypothetical protein